VGGHSLVIPCSVPGISVWLSQVDDPAEAAVSMPVVVLEVSEAIRVMDGHDVRSVIRSLGDAARTLDGNRHTWMAGGTA